MDEDYYSVDSILAENQVSDLTQFYLLTLT